MNWNVCLNLVVKIRGKSLWLLYIALILFLIPISVYKLSESQGDKSTARKVLSAEITLPTLIPNNKLGKITEDAFEKSDGKYGVVIKNLKTDEFYSYNSDDKYNSASLYKLWIMAVAFQKIKDGTLDENDTLSAPLQKLNDTLSTATPTPTPENASPTPSPGDPEIVSMRAGFAIESMITISDNYAALLLASKSGTLSVTNFLKDYGFKNSNFKQPPQTTASDIALFYEKLHKGGVVDKEYSTRMIDILKKQTLNDRIPKYLPEDIEVAHKTGELFNVKHDAGIVFSPQGDYIIVVLSETKDSRTAAEKIAKYSREIYEYFNDN